MRIMLEKLLLAVGQAILPAAAFQAALSGQPESLRSVAPRRLKAGGSQDWLPHISVW